MTRILYLFLILLLVQNGFSQGLNHQWLIGYWPYPDPGFTTSGCARILFNNNTVNVVPEERDLHFRAAQGNISDENGNLLMASNGCWIMNALGDTMMNGSGLNPDQFTTNWCTPYSGIPYHNSNLFLPFPGDSSKYILFHHSGNANYSGAPTHLYFSIIDITLDNGFGMVVQKNQIAIQDTFSMGFAACKHSNGRDWWIVALKDSSDLIYKMLLTPQGIASVTTQSLGIEHPNSGTPVFSPDGTKFAYRQYTDNLGNFNNQVRLFNFNRCTGNFTNPTIIQWQHSQQGLGVSFSSNSKLLYTTTFDRLYQINTDTSDIPASLQLVAINDGYYSPQPPFQSDFWVMYLAANGKIYISSGSSVLDMHFINYPDSGGVACDVQQHALPLPCWTTRAHVNHPNYYLGCDSTLGCSPCYVAPVGISEASHDFKFSVSPNPTSGVLKIVYMLPHASTGSTTEEGKLEIIDITGKIVYEMKLPQWSTLQHISLPSYISNGLYSCVITAGTHRVSKKIAIIKD